MENGFGYHNATITGKMARRLVVKNKLNFWKNFKRRFTFDSDYENTIIYLYNF